MLIMSARTIVYGDDMAQGLFAPIVALYLAWERREVLLRPSAPSAWASLLLLITGALLGLLSVLAVSSTLSRFAFLLSVAGCLLLLGGRNALRSLLFPLALLLYTFPIPQVLYGEITQPLQLLATRLSESMLEMLGYSVVRDGNILHLAHMNLSVVEACSGLRSLLTLSFFCIVYAYFFEKHFRGRTTVALLAIPAAIVANGLRITATGVLGKYNIAWTAGTVHEFVGWSGFFVGFLFVLAAHQAFRQIRPQPLEADQ
jgi:exosortase